MYYKLLIVGFLNAFFLLSALDIEPLAYQNRVFQLQLLNEIKGHYRQELQRSNISSAQFKLYKQQADDQAVLINNFYNQLSARAKTTNEIIAERNKYKYRQVFVIDKGKLDINYRNGILTRAEYEKKLLALNKDIVKQMGALTAEKVAASTYFIWLYIILFVLFVALSAWYYNRRTRQSVPPRDCPVCLEKQCLDRMLVGKKYYDLCRYCGYKAEIKLKK